MNRKFVEQWLNNLKEYWFNKDIVIAEWILKQNYNDYDGVYEIKFNDNFGCIYFKNWEMIIR